MGCGILSKCALTGLKIWNYAKKFELRVNSINIQYAYSYNVLRHCGKTGHEKFKGSVNNEAKLFCMLMELTRNSCWYLIEKQLCAFKPHPVVTCTKALELYSQLVTWQDCGKPKWYSVDICFQWSRSSSALEVPSAKNRALRSCPIEWFQLFIEVWKECTWF